MNPARSLAHAEGASPKDLGEATSNGANEMLYASSFGIFSILNSTTFWWLVVILAVAMISAFASRKSKK